MPQDDGDSLEFQPLDSDDELAEFARKSYRIPVKTHPDFTVRIADEMLPLADLSRTGISFLVSGPTPTPGDILENCEMQLGDETLSKLDAKVVHCSLDDDGDLICGIQWLALDDKHAATLERIMSALREELFK